MLGVVFGKQSLLGSVSVEVGPGDSPCREAQADLMLSL